MSPGQRSRHLWPFLWNRFRPLSLSVSQISYWDFAYTLPMLVFKHFHVTRSKVKASVTVFVKTISSHYLCQFYWYVFNTLYTHLIYQCGLQTPWFWGHQVKGQGSSDPFFGLTFLSLLTTIAAGHHALHQDLFNFVVRCVFILNFCRFQWVILLRIANVDWREYLRVVQRRDSGSLLWKKLSLQR